MQQSIECDTKMSSFIAMVSKHCTLFTHILFLVSYISSLLHIFPILFIAHERSQLCISIWKIHFVISFGSKRKYLHFSDSWKFFISCVAVFFSFSVRWLLLYSNLSISKNFDGCFIPILPFQFMFRARFAKLFKNSCVTTTQVD